MKSLSCLFRFGPGPSSSHTIAPYHAAKSFLSFCRGLNYDEILVTLYGSLAQTGKGHASDVAIKKALSPIPTKFWIDDVTIPPHPLTMDFVALKNNVPVKKARYFSLGGGEVKSNDDCEVNENDIYPFHNFNEIKDFMRKESISTLKEFCLRYEDPFIDDYLLSVTKAMIKSVENGLKAEGKIPANSNPRLNLSRCASSIYQQAKAMPRGDGKKEILLTSYAYAVAESSACGEEVVTAPTCGSSGVLPACLYYLHKEKHVPLNTLRDSLYCAGMFGNIVKQNASIAGSIGGCQAEIGTASSMAAAALCSCDGLSIEQMEYASEAAMEHFLGLSCDPVDGYVIIPCIERNGIGAIRANACYLYAKFISPVRKNQVSFDNVVSAMKLTGDSLSVAYKETAQGGLAEILRQKKEKGDC